MGARFISFMSGEWMLTNGRPNGGDVVIFRTLWVGSILIIFLAALQASEQWTGSLCSLAACTWAKTLVSLRSEKGPLVYGAVYLALYARFTSQWTYMANLYNQIKQAEVGSPANANRRALAQWKAGYIEDAYTTHMATKPMVAGVIRAWHSDQAVRHQFEKHTKNHREIVGWLCKHKVL